MVIYNRIYHYRKCKENLLVRWETDEEAKRIHVADKWLALFIFWLPDSFMDHGRFDE